MLLELLGLAPVWTLQNEGGGTAVDFDVFLGVDFSGDNQVAHEPIEEGGFASYNTQNTPKEITVELASTKMYFNQQPVLEAIDKLASALSRAAAGTSPTPRTTKSRSTRPEATRGLSSRASSAD